MENMFTSGVRVKLDLSIIPSACSGISFLVAAF